MDPKRLPRGSQEAPKTPQKAPKRPQEAPKRLPRGPKRYPKGPQAIPDVFRRTLGAANTAQEIIPASQDLSKRFQRSPNGFGRTFHSVILYVFLLSAARRPLQTRACKCDARPPPAKTLPHVLATVYFLPPASDYFGNAV